jgi:hypothetical protein
MSKEYVLKTNSGSLYEVIDESHLLGFDVWVIMVKGKRNVILYFGKYRKMTPGILTIAKGRGETAYVKIKPLEGEVGMAITKGTCIGQNIFYVDERLIAPYLKARDVPSDVWENTITKNAENTSSVFKVFMKIH